MSKCKNCTTCKNALCYSESEWGCDLPKRNTKFDFPDIHLIGCQSLKDYSPRLDVIDGSKLPWDDKDRLAYCQAKFRAWAYEWKIQPSSHPEKAISFEKWDHGDDFFDSDGWVWSALDNWHAVPAEKATQNEVDDVNEDRESEYTKVPGGESLPGIDNVVFYFEFYQSSEEDRRWNGRSEKPDEVTYSAEIEMSDGSTLIIPAPLGEGWISEGFSWTSKGFSGWPIATLRKDITHDIGKAAFDDNYGITKKTVLSTTKWTRKHPPQEKYSNILHDTLLDPPKAPHIAWGVADDD